MALIQYTAKRSLAGGHVVDGQYGIELDLLDAQPDMQDVKSEARSPGGALEIAYERQDVFWTIRLGPVSGYELELLREFLDSIESGEIFQIWLWPEDTIPLSLKCLEDGHTEEAFMRRGGEREDYFTGQFTALQVSPYDICGAGYEVGGIPSGAQGGGGATLDMYSPDSGDIDP